MFKGKAIYNPSGKAGEYSYWACNFFKGCDNDCDYCYLKKGVLARNWTPYAVLKQCFRNEDHAIQIFKKELIQNLKELQEKGLFFTFSSDPALPKTWLLTCRAINICRDYDVPFKILTKRTDWLIDQFLFELEANGTIWNRDPKIHLWAFGFTLTGHDELEKNASKNIERIMAMKKLKAAGFKTFASIEPIIDFWSARRMIEATIDHCDLYKVGLQSGKKYDVVEAQSFVEWLNELPQCNNTGHPKIYLKESLQKLTRYRNEELDSFFVTRDYNIFKLNTHV